MTTLFRKIILGSVLIWGAVSCSSETDLQGFDGSDNEVTFTAAPVSRAVGAHWTAGDCIGVFMKTTGTELEGTALVGSTANIPYTTTAGDGLFTATGTKLYYPHDGSAVDFIAYSPYTTSVTAGVYAVDVSDQTNSETIDLLYADNLTGQTKSSGSVALNFTHQLATLELTLQSADGNAIDGLAATVKDVYTTADFALKDATFSNYAGKGDVKMNITGSGTTLTATALLLPDLTTTEELKPLVVSLTDAAGKTMEVTLADDLRPAKGRRYTYTLNITASTASSTATYIHWTETPTITTEQLESEHIKYVTHHITVDSKEVRNYSMLYDTDLKMAYWVAYPLCNFYVTRNTSRTEDWAADPSFTATEQADFSKAISGYQRGHQIPSADRYVSYDANAQTFYYTNMTPQNGDLNGGMWGTLENKVRAWSSNIDTLYVVTGASPTESLTSTAITYATDIAGQQVAVPKYYYKALLRIDRETGTAYTIAFKLDNAKPSSSDLMDYAISVAELETLTGFTFFPSIDASYKQSYDSSKWQ